MLIIINKLASFSKSSSQRGEERTGKYLKRIVTGKDKDGSPQYRYIRSKTELEAYERLHGKDEEDKKDTKETHEKQKKKYHKIRQELGVEEDPKEKKGKKKIYILDTKREKQEYSRDKSKDKVKKSIYV